MDNIDKSAPILITGGTGVLGKYIVAELLEIGYTNITTFSRRNSNSDRRVKHIQGDVLELYPLSEAIENSDFVIHAAAIVSYDPRMFNKMHEINVIGTSNVVNAAIESQIKKMIHISSIAAFSKDDRTTVVDEANEWTNSDLNSYYGITKYHSEQEVWRAHYEGLSMAIVNPSVILGAGDWGQSSLQIFERVFKGIPYHPGGGTSVVDAKDVARAVRLLMESEISGQRFILSAENISYKSLFKKMAAQMNVKSPDKKAPMWIMQIMWRVEWLRSRLFNTTPLVTKHSVKTMRKTVTYDNSKSLTLPGFSYRKVDDSINDYCALFMKSIRV